MLNIPNTIMSAAMECFWLRTHEQVRNSHGKRAISVRATEVLLYMKWYFFHGMTDLLQVDKGTSRKVKTAEFMTR